MDLRYASTPRYYVKLVPWLLFRRPSGTDLRHLISLNPCFGLYDLFGVSRITVSEVLRGIGLPQPQQVIRPPTISQDSYLALCALLEDSKGLIAKPEFGARSRGIQIIENEEQLKYFCRSRYRQRVLVQEFVAGDEFSVRFVRKSDGCLRSCALIERQKVYLTGDGRSTFGELAMPLLDAHQKSRAKKIHGGRWNSIPPEGDRRLLSSLGVHSLGARFVRSSEPLLAVTEMEGRFDRLEGFNYCRVDFIVSQDRSKYWILEVNGSNAEPLEAYEEPIDVKRFYAIFRRSFSERLKIGRGLYSSKQALPRKTEILSELVAGIRRYFLP